MIFRQLFEPRSSTFSYLLAKRPGAEAVLIDPVRDEVDTYLRLLTELDVRLLFAIDTHVHADHITGLGALHMETGCDTVMGEQSRAVCVSHKVQDGEVLQVDGLTLRAIHTPGHTDDSYSFVMHDRVFTGDTLLIGSTGRTDFQNGDPAAQYDSIFGKLLTLPDATQVYPAHDYKGHTVSTIGAERATNPRLQVTTRAAYVAQMRALKLASPAMMDVAVPANLACGLPYDRHRSARPATGLEEAR